MRSLNKLNILIKFNKINSLRCLSSTAPCFNHRSVFIDRHSNVTMIGINRPSSRNSLDSETLSLLINELQMFDEDKNAKVAILHGEGGNFSSGFDMEEINDKGFDKILSLVEFFKRQPLCRKPVIAAVSGFAVAEGFELALACDLRVVEDTASLGALGRRFGAPMLMGGARRLSQLVGASKAMDLVFTGRLITGTTAYEWGLAARPDCSTGSALGQSLNLGTEIAKFPIAGLQYDKMQIYGSQNEEELKKYKDEALRDMQKHAAKFKEGFGRHGSFKNLRERQLASWEIEDELEQKKLS